MAGDPRELAPMPVPQDLKVVFYSPSERKLYDDGAITSMPALNAITTANATDAPTSYALANALKEAMNALLNHLKFAGFMRDGE